jgi:hypothetical protein
MIIGWGFSRSIVFESVIAGIGYVRVLSEDQYNELTEHIKHLKRVSRM